jgi:MFS family permease
MIKDKYSIENRRSYENLLLVLLFFTVGFVFFDRLAISFLFPFMREEFDLSNTKMGVLASTLSLTWAVSGMVFSSYADRRHKRKTVLIASVIAFSVCSISSGLVSTFAMLVAARALMGLAEGPVLPLSQSLMAIASSDSRRGFNMGLIESSASGLLGAMLAPAVLVPLAGIHGWRVAFYCAGIPGLLLAVALFFWVREPNPNDQRNSQLAGQISNSSCARVEGAETFWSVLLSRNILICMLLSCLYLVWFVAILTFGPTYLLRYRNFSAADMSVFMTVLGVSSVVGGSLVPALSDRFGRKPIMMVFCLLGACSPLVLAFMPGTLTLLCTFIFACYLGYGCFSILMSTIPAESVPPQYVSRSIALVIGVGEIIGGCVAPTLMGVAADTYGAAAPFIISSTALICALGASAFLIETSPKHAASSAKTILVQSK